MVEEMAEKKAAISLPDFLLFFFRSVDTWRKTAVAALV
jgi:hypothetical protein